MQGVECIEFPVVLFIYLSTWMETISERFSFESLIKEIHFKERWRQEEKR